MIHKAMISMAHLIIIVFSKVPVSFTRTFIFLFSAFLCNQNLKKVIKSKKSAKNYKK